MSIKIRLSTVFIIAFLAVAALFVSGLLRGSLMNDDGIREIVGREFPDSDAEIIYTENCTVCDGLECRNYPGPCWKVDIISETGDGLDVTSMLFDGMGNELDRGTRPCTEWWCTAEQCVYSYSVTEGDTSISYTNTGCGSQEMSCDQSVNRCRPCIEGNECIGITVLTEPGREIHKYEVLMTGEYAEIDSSEGLCRIYSRGGLIFSELMDVESCGSMITENTACYDGSCDYVPKFDLLS
jgi:hypothetical protein